MKRLITLLITLLLFIIPAFADQTDFTPYDYHIMYTANGNYVVYDFPDIIRRCMHSHRQRGTYGELTTWTQPCWL